MDVLSPAQPTLADLADLVRWYAEVGVDIALDEAPHDRLAEGALEARRRANLPERVAAAGVAPVAEVRAADRAPLSPGLRSSSVPANPAAALTLDPAVL